MKTLILSAIMMLPSVSTMAQKDWTLSQCIDYAIEHNISLKQRENECERQKVSLSTARNAFLPDLNLGASQDFSFGRSLGMDNTYSKRNTSSTGFSLSTSVPLFTGKRLTNTVVLNQLNLEAVRADLEKARNDIRTQIAQQYIQIVYDRELLEVARHQIAIDSMQCARLQEMEKHGKATLTDVLQQQSTMAQSQLTATQAENSYHLDLLALSQLLELPSPEGFTIALPTPADDKSIVESLNPEMIFNEAVAIKPEVHAGEMRVKASETSIQIAKADLYPSLSFRAGLGTNYYNSSGMQNDGFGSQMKNNFSQQLGFSLNVPIFNRFSTRNNIRAARIERENQQLSLDNVKKTLYKEIQQLYYNTVAAEAKYKKSQQAQASSQQAFDLTQGKYENGKATITEFNEAKYNLLKADSDLIQARYELVFQRALIDFYRGKELKF